MPVVVGAAERAPSARLSARNPYVGFFTHSPVVEGSQLARKVAAGGALTSPVELARAKALRNSAASGSFHAAPGVFSPLHWRARARACAASGALPPLPAAPLAPVGGGLAAVVITTARGRRPRLRAGGSCEDGDGDVGPRRQRSFEPRAGSRRSLLAPAPPVLASVKAPRLKIAADDAGAGGSGGPPSSQSPSGGQSPSVGNGAGGGGGGAGGGDTARMALDAWRDDWLPRALEIGRASCRERV
jgi:hypothetical protein